MKTTAKQQDESPCLVCADETDAIAVKRGLCISCYEKFRRAREKFHRNAWPAFEQKMIERNLLAPDARSSENVFEQIADELRKEMASDAIPPTPGTLTPVGRKKPAPPTAMKKTGKKTGTG